MRPSESTSAAAERTSSGQPAMRWLTSVSGDDDVAALEERLVVVERPARPATFVPTSGKRRTSSFAASTRSTTTGNGSYSTATSSAASAPVARSGLRTTATMSPTKRTTSFATTGRRHPLLEHGDRRRARRDVDVGAREDLHVRQRLCRRRVDSDDAGVREERADERDRERAFERQVLDVRRFAAEEARVFLPEHAVPEDAHSAEPIVARSGVQQQVRQSEHFASPFRQRPSTARTAAATSPLPGRYASSSGGLNGNGRERRADPLDRRVELVERGRLHLRGDLGAEAAVHDRLVRDDEPVRPASPTRRSSRGRAERASAGRSPRPRSRPPPAPRRRRATPSTSRESATTVTSRPGRDDARAADRNRLRLVRDVLLAEVERLVLDEDHRVRVGDRAREQARGIGSRARHHDLEPGYMREPRLEALRVLRARRADRRRPACAARGAR